MDNGILIKLLEDIDELKKDQTYTVERAYLKGHKIHGYSVATEKGFRFILSNECKVLGNGYVDIGWSS